MANDHTDPPPPLYCYGGLSNDEFAGWYPVSNSNKCNDFCFWKQPDEYYTYDGKNMFGYTTADPHQLTQTLNGGTWGCLKDATGDDDTWSTAFDIYADYKGYNTTFPHLKCSRGPGQTLKSTWQQLANSIAFFWVLMLVSMFIIILEVLIFLRLRLRRLIWLEENDNTPAGIGEDSETNENQNADRLRVSSRQESSAETKEECEQKNDLPCEDANDDKHAPHTNCDDKVETTPHENDQATRKYNRIQRIRSMSPKFSPRLKKIVIIAALIILNLAAIWVILMSSVSLLELQQGVDLPFRLKTLTPACADADAMCPAGHDEIDRESKDRTEGEAFSYLIASDAQVDWYNGESAYIGRLNYPPPCSSGDSCKSCTKKMGEYTNQQMKLSFEKLVQENDAKSPTPRTLIMNGDLTQYFHRDEYLKYASFYHNISGLQSFFPSLGNHDYDQGSATFNGDEWIGPNYCNGRHAVAYFRNAFCNKIPNFDAKKRVTRYDPKSLAYSWEEGNYHFVNVHYYPVYENAALGISSSLQWLERDLMLASEKNLTNILYVHSVYGISQSIERILLKNKVAVIFAGHLHRCFGGKCSYLTALNTKQAGDYLNNTDSNNIAKAEKCFPASAALCGTNANGNGMFYLRDMSDDLTLPEKELWSEVPVQLGKCPGKFAIQTDFINVSCMTSQQ